MADQLPFAGPLWFKQIADVVRGNDTGTLALSALFDDADGARFQPGGDDQPPHNVSEFYGYPNVATTYEWDSTVYTCEISAPTANFTISDNTPLFNTYIVVASTSTGTISSYSWTFSGDSTPSTSTSSSVNVKWATQGTKTITLTVTGPGGSDSIQKTVNVSNVVGEAVYGSQDSNVTGSGIYKTDDGGISQSHVSSDITKRYQWKYALADNSVMWMTEHSGTLVGPNYNGAIAKSTNEGDSWTITTVSGYTWVNPRGIGFADSNTGWISSYSNGGARILKTTNGGTNWTSQFYSSSSSIFVSAVMPYSTSRVLIGSFSGYYKTTNGGTNWTKITNSQMNAVFSFAKIGSVTYMGVGGSTQSIWKSTDDGDSWTKVSDITFVPQSMCFPTVDRGYATTRTGPWVYVTQNGGVSWTKETLSYSGGDVYDVDYSNDSIGFATMADGNVGLFKTTDGGGYWGPTNVSVSNYAPVIAKKF
jgi:PKD repeat protein